MSWRRLWGGLLACGLTASLLTSSTAATATTESSATSGSSSACAGGAQETGILSGHPGTASLTNTATRQGEHYTFFATAEGADTNAIFRATTAFGCWDGAPGFARARVRYTTDAGSATAGTDYVHVVAPTTPTNPPANVPDQTGWICRDQHPQGCQPPRSSDPPQRPTPVTILQSPGGEAVKSFRIRLTGAQVERNINPDNPEDHNPTLDPFSINNTASHSRSRTVHIVDDDGSSRFSLEPTFADASQAITYQREEFSSETSVWIPVFRAGSTTSTEVDYQLVPSGVHPATEGTDYTDLSSGTVTFPTSPTVAQTNGVPWSRLAWIKIALNWDRVGEEDETFDIVLTNPNNPTGATSSTFTILDSDGGPDPDPDPEMHPKGKLHHPKLNYKYPRNYPYLNEIHLFTRNAKGLPYPRDEYECPGTEDYCEWRVIFADLAIRKRFKSGKCVWWTGSRFAEGTCSNKRWFRMTKPQNTEDYFLYRIKEPLPKSVGSSRVKDYKAWSRWFDASANVSTFRKGANMNSFEVIPSTKACRNKKTRFNSRLCKPIKPKN